MGGTGSPRLADPRLSFLGAELVALGCGDGKSRLPGYGTRLRGHGDSPRGDDYLLASYATDVLALDREWDVVVGHSLGGAIAAIAQTTDRSFADRLVLEDPLLRLSEPESFIAEYTKPFEDPRAGAVLAQNPRWHPQDARIKAEALEASSRRVQAPRSIVQHFAFPGRRPTRRRSSLLLAPEGRAPAP